MSNPAWLWVALFCWSAVMSHILRGWQLSGVGPRGLIDLARAPLFLAWKLAVMLSSRNTAAWTRTTREEPRQN